MRLARRGIEVSYEAIRQWCLKFGQTFANDLRCRRPRPGDKWHLDEVVLEIKGKLCYLWRAVDQHGVILDILVQSRRNTKAATKFFKKLLKGLQYVPRVIITDKLRSYGAAKRELLPRVEHHIGFGCFILIGQIFTNSGQIQVGKPTGLAGSLQVEPEDRLLEF